MKRKGMTVLLTVFFLAGISLILYPSVSNYWNTAHQSKAISDYSHAVRELSDENYAALLASAQSYNDSLLFKTDRYGLSEKEQEEYRRLLNPDGKGVMGSVEIPKIKVSMPIYHTTESDVLQFAAGHIPGTSLPVGGKGTHCALSGHRGLPSARLFTDLDKLQTGDFFSLDVLQTRLTYEIDKVLVVEPDNMDELDIDPDADLVTLVTCTPYGINTHRLLVRGHRTDNPDGTGTYFSSEAIQIEPVLVASVLSAPALGLLALISALRKRRPASSTIRKKYQKGK